MGIAALAAAGRARGSPPPSIRRVLSRPSLQTITFEVATVDDKGMRNPAGKIPVPQPSPKRSALSGGLDMVAIPAGSFTMGSPADEPERQPN